MRLSAALWSANADLAEAAMGHPFVRGLADGSLAESTFAGYVAQDAFFLDAFARAYAMGVVRSPDREALDAFADLLQGVREELRLHASYAAGWGIDLRAVQPHEATLAYTGFLSTTATAESDVGRLCAAMAPCMRLYAYLGSALAGTDCGRYQEWVETYSSPEFEALARTLERLLDRYAADVPPVRSAYRRAMQLEIAFFDAAWSSAAG